MRSEARLQTPQDRRDQEVIEANKAVLNESYQPLLEAIQLKESVGPEDLQPLFQFYEELAELSRQSRYATESLTRSLFLHFLPALKRQGTLTPESDEALFYFFLDMASDRTGSSTMEWTLGISLADWEFDFGWADETQAQEIDAFLESALAYPGETPAYSSRTRASFRILADQIRGTTPARMPTNQWKKARERLDNAIEQPEAETSQALLGICRVEKPSGKRV